MIRYVGQRVLVTGGTGFIGSALVRRLATMGATVFVASRSIAESPEGSVKYLSGDLAQLDGAQRIFAASEPQIVFHLASEVLGARELEHVGSTLQANLVAAVNVMICAVRGGCERLVLAGSMEEPADSDCPSIPTSPYAAAKWAATSYARMFNAVYDTPIVMARLFMVYGPGQRDVSKLVPYVATSLLNGRAPCVTAGTRPVDWIFIDDVVSGLLACGSVPHIEGQRLDLGSGALTTVRTVVEILGRYAAPELSIEFGARPARRMETTPIAKVQETDEVLGWRPQVQLTDGLSRTVDWYRENQHSLN